jgi:tetratricopeptide (TPR) repeat protein
MAMNNLASSYDHAGRRAEALKMNEEMLALSRKVRGPEHPLTLMAMNNVAISCNQAGRLDEALKLREERLPLFLKVAGPKHPNTLLAMQNLADSYCSVGRSSEAISLLQKACAADPKDTDASLTLAVWQIWFGHDADYEATRRRLVQQAQGTDLAATAERAAKAACLRPSTDAALLAKALALAQQAVELGKSNPSLPWYQLTLGLAEYRNGQFAGAEQTLAGAEQKLGGHPEILGIARLFRAVSLFRQDRSAEARKLFSRAEAEMPPFPQDEHKPLVDGKPVSHDHLICWMACQEAKKLIEGPTTVK